MKLVLQSQNQPIPGDNPVCPTVRSNEVGYTSRNGNVGTYVENRCNVLNSLAGTRGLSGSAV